MNEPNLPLRWAMFHFAGGDALFVALFILIAIAAAERRPSNPGRGTLLTLMALIWGGLSSPAWPISALAALVSLIVAWRIVMHRRKRHARQALVMRWSMGLVLLAMAVGELCIASNMRSVEEIDRLCVVGDSVTAGVKQAELTWPRRLAEETGLAVRDGSQAGATLRSALKQVALLDDADHPLVLEIGGNDLLAGLPLDEFCRDLEALCQQVCSPGRIVWMCELPLPPMYSRYGFEQRRICWKYGIQLISKRKFMGVLTTAGATVDGIHLSASGQRLFCDLMWRETGRQRLDAAGGQYVKCDRRTSL